MGRIVFSGGEVVESSADARALMQNLSRVRRGAPVVERGQELPPGFVDVHTDDGVVYVNPDAVAYVSDASSSPSSWRPAGD